MMKYREQVIELFLTHKVKGGTFNEVWEWSGLVDQSQVSSDQASGIMGSYIRHHGIMHQASWDHASSITGACIKHHGIRHQASWDHASGIMGSAIEGSLAFCKSLVIISSMILGPVCSLLSLEHCPSCSFLMGWGFLLPISVDVSF